MKVVTDSTADLPSELAEALGITVVPLTVHFGEEIYRDGMDMSPDEFFHRLQQSPSLPTTSQPPAGVFAELYTNLSRETSEIVSIHISAKLSGTYQSAVLGCNAITTTSRIAVIDSLQASMGVGLIVIAAARAAQAGMNLDQVTELVQQAIARTHFFGTVDTLEYLQKGGRIGKAQALLGTMLNVKPIIGVRDGEAHPFGRVRTKRKALERIAEMVEELQPIEEMAAMHSTAADDVELLLERLEAVFPKERVHRARFGPVIGTYLGPGSIGIALRQSGLEEPR